MQFRYKQKKKKKGVKKKSNWRAHQSKNESLEMDELVNKEPTKMYQVKGTSDGIESREI